LFVSADHRKAVGGIGSPDGFEPPNVWIRPRSRLL